MGKLLWCRVANKLRLSLILIPSTWPSPKDGTLQAECSQTVTIPLIIGIARLRPWTFPARPGLVRQVVCPIKANNQIKKILSFSLSSKRVFLLFILLHFFQIFHTIFTFFCWLDYCFHFIIDCIFCINTMEK